MKTESPATEKLRANAGIPLLLLGGLLVAAAILYIPFREKVTLQRDLQAARDELAKLEILHPLYMELTLAGRHKHWNILPCPPRETWTQAEVVEVPASFAGMAGENGLEMISIHPRVTSVPGSPRRLYVEVEVAGSYDRFKDFLLAVVGMPVLDRLGKIDIRREAMHETMKLSMWLALD